MIASRPRSLLLHLAGVCLLTFLACGEDPPAGGAGTDTGLLDPDGGSGDVGFPDSGIPPSDGDNDGLPDDWERMNGLDPNRNDANEDFDGDGINNTNEFRLGTKANDIDTDDDGVADGDEDANRNGAIDPGETSPIDADSDDDGLTDGQELGKITPLTSARPGVSGTDPAVFVADGNNATTTDPNNADTDGDQIPDGVEDLNRNGRIDAGETDPLDLDSDDDGLADGVEDVNFNGVTDAGETNATDADSDDDGLADGVERGINTPVLDPDGAGPLKGTDTAVWRPDTDPASTTNPLARDTDGDGVADGDEDWNRNGAVDPGELDPGLTDSDNDGIPDAQEGVALVCAESALRRINLHALASADLTVALPPEYSEVSILRAAGGVGVGIMFADPASGVVGFAISKTPTGGDAAAEKQAIRAALAQDASLSNEQDRALISWDGFPAVFTTASANNGRDTLALAGTFAERLAGGTLSGALPAGGAAPGNFTLYYETIYRSAQRATIVVALAPAPTADAQLIALSDVSNGTGVAQFGDFTGVGCDQFTTPDGNDVIDMIWVVDNSCSMSEEQTAVANAGDEMVALLTTTQLSWRLALLTTDQGDGSLTARGVNGFTVSTPRPQAEAESQAWATAIDNLGTGGSGEERGLVVGATAVQNALPGSATEINTKFRAGATAIVVHLSDEEDYSVKQGAGGSDASCPENAGKQAQIDALIQQYLQLSMDPTISGLTTFAIHGTQPNTNGLDYCTFSGGSSDCSASQHGRAYVDVAAAMGGGSGSICGNMNQVVQDIIRAGAGIASQIELTQPPISSTIRVVMADANGSFVGQPDVPRSRTNGFDYTFELDVMANVVRHKIIFYGMARPPARRELMISYRTWRDGSPNPGGPVCDCPEGQVCDPDDNSCVIDPTCGGGCPEDQVCDPQSGLCHPDDPCMGQCVIGEICVDGACLPDDPCDGLCTPAQFCDTSTDPPMCRDRI
ncbi:MAG: hypothetical protein IPG45_07615 [Deltaproteobacteria bacterium]|nr:hypothetical protein [Deltaproteobacteria bacterium]